MYLNLLKAKLVSVAEETGLSLALSENPKDRFCRDKAHVHDGLSQVFLVLSQECHRQLIKLSQVLLKPSLGCH